MTADIKYLKSQIDLRLEVEKDLGPPSKRGANEWTFRCPFHDERTVGGFHVYTDRYRCFSCGEIGDIFDWRQKIHNQPLVDAIKFYGGDKGMDRDAVLKFAAERAENAAKELEQKIHQAQSALADLRSAQVWLKYHENLLNNNNARAIWRGRGIPDFWQEWWKLGYCENYALWRKDDNGEFEKWWESPTISIPIWGHDWEIYNVKHRLLRPPETGDKYIQEKRHVPSYSFIANDEVKKGTLLLLEGEIKAMVTFITIDDIKLQVAGLPTATPSEDCLKIFDDYEPICVCLDPDAYEARKGGSPIQKLIDKLGEERVRIIWIPTKIDDAILTGDLDKWKLKSLMRSARKCVV